jgi:hypothetical protein
MPAPSKAMRRASAIAEHHPEELYSRNKGLLGMTHGQLHDFASTSEKGLPKRKKHVVPRGGKR